MSTKQEIADSMCTNIENTFKIVFDNSVHALVLLSTAFNLPITLVLAEFQQYSNTLLDVAIEKAKSSSLDS